MRDKRNIFGGRGQIERNICMAAL